MDKRLAFILAGIVIGYLIGKRSKPNSTIQIKSNIKNWIESEPSLIERGVDSEKVANDLVSSSIESSTIENFNGSVIK